MNLEEQILDQLGKQMQQHMDNELLWSMIVMDCSERGWHMVNLDRFTDNHQAVDIVEWIENKSNIKGEYHRNGRHFIFEHAKDANWFTLRWGVAHDATT